MNSKNLILLIAASSLYLIGCQDKAKKNESGTKSPAELQTDTDQSAVSDMHNSQNALDWNGTYSGLIPCADCDGIQTSVTLQTDGKYTRTTTYMGKEVEGTTYNGTFEWNASGAIITLIENGERIQEYKVGENVLFHLDREGNRIEGDLADNYRLLKNTNDKRLERKKWVLKELMGKELVNTEAQGAFITFDPKVQKFSGNNTCNVFSGSYTLTPGDRIRMEGIAVTMRACPEMEIANALNEVLNKTDNYTVTDGMLSLNKAKMAPLAKFALAKEE